MEKTVSAQFEAKKLAVWDDINATLEQFRRKQSRKARKEQREQERLAGLEAGSYELRPNKNGDVVLRRTRMLGDAECLGMTKAGAKCRRKALTGSAYCKLHGGKLKFTPSAEYRARMQRVIAEIEVKLQAALNQPMPRSG